MFKFALEVMPSDDEKQLGHKRLRVYRIIRFPLLSVLSKSSQALFYSPTFDRLVYNTLKKTKIVEFLTCIAANCLQQKEQVRNTRISNHDDGPINVVLWSTVCRRDRPYACMPAWLWLQGTSCQALVHQPTSSVVQVGSLFADVFFWSLLLHSGSLLLYSSIFVC